ncbi:FAD-dependent oxidoreductase [Gordonia sp. SID5947]|uniref:phytoene desaturase family protein n=1 Tax=Gordonia sp. SID5947 TaxID=2690315 RepID=UPI001368BC98|nr:NAD(P)/FAD-dependent oxidoreductase [Gordonia sp. SID5947]MYR05225.1 FAD-dependent oxidoreductase [Gordonia sp. SID5947]
MTSAVVVGSGPNGLAAAIRLAQDGLDVTVFEADDRPGGGTRSSELTVPGVVHDECAAFHPTGVASPFFSSLDLERHGLTWRWPEVDLAHPLDDGRAGLAARDRSHTARSLGADARTWDKLFRNATNNFDDLIAEVFRPLAHAPRHPFVLGRFGVHALAPATWTTRRFDDDPARALFTGVAAHAFTRLDTPLSSSVGMMLTAAAHAVGWPIAEGGTESITRALVAELATLGGKVVTGTPINSIGQLRDLTGSRPDIVILDTAPQGALRILGDELPGRIRSALGRYRYGPAAFKVDLAIEGDIPWTNADCTRAGTVHLGGTAEEIAHVEKQTVRGVMAERPFVLLGQQYLIDRTRSQGSVNPVYAYAHVPHGYTGDATEAIIGQIERFAPGFRDRIVAVSTRNPAALEEHNANYVGGDISAGANTARQIAFRPRVAVNPYALGIPGVYLCSSATPPGAGVHGMGGFHAAESALARAH